MFLVEIQIKVWNYHNSADDIHCERKICLEETKPGFFSYIDAKDGKIKEWNTINAGDQLISTNIIYDIPQDAINEELEKLNKRINEHRITLDSLIKYRVDLLTLM